MLKANESPLALVSIFPASLPKFRAASVGDQRSRLSPLSRQITQASLCIWRPLNTLNVPMHITHGQRCLMCLPIRGSWSGNLNQAVCIPRHRPSIPSSPHLINMKHGNIHTWRRDKTLELNPHYRHTLSVSNATGYSTESSRGAAVLDGGE